MPGVRSVKTTDRATVSPTYNNALPSARRIAMYGSEMLADTQGDPVEFVLMICICLPSCSFYISFIHFSGNRIPESSSVICPDETCTTQDLWKNGPADTVEVPIRPICSGVAFVERAKIYPRRLVRRIDEFCPYITYSCLAVLRAE